MIKIQITLFLVFITVDSLVGNCVQESSANKEVKGVLDKSELFSAEAFTSEKKAVETDNEDLSKSDVIEQGVDPANKHLDFVDERAKPEDFHDLIETGSSLEEKSATDELVGEQKSEKLEKLKNESKTEESVKKESEKSGENTEKQLEKLPEISKSVIEIEEKKAEDLLEASAESKLSDNEMTSTIHESDRNGAKSEELNDKPDELGLDEITATRRMLSQPFTVIDTKSNSNEGPSIVVPEDNNARDPTVNANNNFEFGSESSNLIDRARVSIQNSKLNPPQTVTDPHISLKSSTPETKKEQSQQIVQQLNLPQYYPRSKLNIDFPTFDLQSHKPRGVPIYLQLEQNPEQLKNSIIETQSTPIEERQFYQSQNSLDLKDPLVTNQFQHIGYEMRDQDQQLHQNHRISNLNTDAGNLNMDNLFYNPRSQNQQFQTRKRLAPKTPLENNEFENLSLESTINIPLYHQYQPILPSIIPIDFKRFSDDTHSETFSHAPTNHVQLLQNPGNIDLEKIKQSENFNHQQRNQPQQFFQAHKIVDPNMFSENKIFENVSHEKIAYPYLNMQVHEKPRPNIFNTPATNYVAPLNNFKTIFQTLLDATRRPKKIKHLPNTEFQQIYPNFLNQNNHGSYFYDNTYESGFEY